MWGNVGRANSVAMTDASVGVDCVWSSLNDFCSPRYKNYPPGLSNGIKFKTTVQSTIQLCVFKFSLPVTATEDTVCCFKWVWPSFPWQFHSFLYFKSDKWELHYAHLCNTWFYFSFFPPWQGEWVGMWVGNPKLLFTVIKVIKSRFLLNNWGSISWI